MSKQADIIAALVASLDAVTWTATADPVTVETKNFPQYDIEELENPVMVVTDGGIDIEPLKKLTPAMGDIDDAITVGQALAGVVGPLIEVPVPVRMSVGSAMLVQVTAQLVRADDGTLLTDDSGNTLTVN